MKIHNQTCIGRILIPCWWQFIVLLHNFHVKKGNFTVFLHLYGVPMRPVLSMSCSAYHRVTLKVTKWLTIVEECRINSSTKSISQSLSFIQLDEDEVAVSFNVISLYTNVRARKAIDICSDYLFSGKHKISPVSNATFKSLLEKAAGDV